MGVNEQVGKQKAGRNQGRWSHQSSPLLPRDLSEETGEQGQRGMKLCEHKQCLERCWSGAQPCAGGFLFPLVWGMVKQRQTRCTDGSRSLNYSEQGQDPAAESALEREVTLSQLTLPVALEFSQSLRGV